jgi:hypothetical protein
VHQNYVSQKIILGFGDLKNHMERVEMLWYSGSKVFLALFPKIGVESPYCFVEKDQVHFFEYVVQWARVWR